MERQLNSSRGYRSLTDWSDLSMVGPSRCVGPDSGCQGLQDRRRPSSPNESTDGGQGPVRARSTPAVARPPECTRYARASGHSWATVTAASGSSGDSGSAFPAYGPGLTPRDLLPSWTSPACLPNCLPIGSIWTDQSSTQADAQHAQVDFHERPALGWQGNGPERSAPRPPSIVRPDPEM
jgi:hypothetical protein